MVRPSSLERTSVDTTVQPRAIACPTDAKLYLKALLALLQHAKRRDLTLRQSHTRLANPAACRWVAMPMPVRCGACDGSSSG